ncbi:MAG TPA: uracil-DNA glycosylase family protein, partial [Flavobacteriales bacterium]|nr:uracil-DNA glycosylase family protein [Flavobacteriales bacterium]
KLHINQEPLLDTRTHADAMWVRLSAVAIGDGEDSEPLSASTRSGWLVSSIEAEFTPQVSFYKTNLVKCLPLHSTGKIRYPSGPEMDKCYHNLENEVAIFEPKLVFLLGKQVATFVGTRVFGHEIGFTSEFKYSAFQSAGTMYVPIHHPSFMLVYGRAMMLNYIAGVCTAIAKHAGNLGTQRSSRILHALHLQVNGGGGARVGLPM